MWVSLKQCCLKYGRKILLTVLMLFSTMLISHFVAQYYYKASLIDKLFTTKNYNIKASEPIKPMPRPSPTPPGAGLAPQSSEPKGGGSKQEQLSPSASSPHIDDVKVEIFGLIKFEMSETNSWETIAKILTVVLGTFFGIRLINTIFGRLEDHDQSPKTS